MKIIFQEKVSDNCMLPFALYEDEGHLEKHLQHIDLKKIFRENLWSWLDQIQISYDDVAICFSKKTRWWWITPMSRLDVRPYAQDYLFKPLLFAKALIEWKKKFPEIKEIILVGCDPLVGKYLAEFDPSLLLVNNKNTTGKEITILFFLKHVMMSVIQILRCSYFLVRYHLFKNNKRIDCPVAILFESVSDDVASDDYKYFFGSMFDNCNGLDKSKIKYICINCRRKKNAIKREGSINDSDFMLLDNINISDLVQGFAIGIFIILVTCLTAFRNIPCYIGESCSRMFWKKFLVLELSRGFYLYSFCCYKVLKREDEKSQCKAIIYPYEEKSIERAILFAAQEKGIDSFGYTPNPQYRSALALRDKTTIKQPRPKMYRVCGPAYKEYLSDWGGKDRTKISVWGTEKHLVREAVIHSLNRGKLKILVLISHPDELKMLHSWLKNKKILTERVTYLIRIYKAVNKKIFDLTLHQMSQNFECVTVTNGSFEEDLSKCDFTVFCATSAGLLAINYGYLSVFLDLRGFFPINPCFDELDVMLKCSNADEFADRIEKICKMDKEEIRTLHLLQLECVERIYHPVQYDEIRRDLKCYMN